jgi:hypothetical protein
VPFRCQNGRVQPPDRPFAPTSRALPVPGARRTAGAAVTRHAVTRRAALAGAGVVALGVTAGCNPFSSGSTPAITVTQTVAPAADPMPGLIATTRLHLLNLQAAVAVDKADAATLTQLAKDRQTQLDALLGEYARTDPAAADQLKRATGTVPPPADAAAAMAGARQDAADAESQFTDAVGLVSRYRAALLGSIRACLETHRVVLG